MASNKLNSHPYTLNMLKKRK